ncbi:PAS domain-containing sensor histidine kinase, partial [Desulfosporosinus sp. OT]|uniref:PAS domain-containing sensor histidine kinase n=1 Tax=Desulfosporosinus sp. OT TaxID=913865 RepID=UPI000223AE89
TLIDLVFVPQPHDRKLYDVIGKDGSTVFSEGYCPLPNKDHGAYLWGTASPFYDSHGNIVGAIECTRDISQRKQADKDLRIAKERFRKAFDASPAIMAVSEVADGRYLYVNDQFIQALGFSRDELIGISALELNIWSNPQERLQMIAILIQHGSVRNHLAHIRVKNGNIRIGLLSVEKIEFDGKQRLLVAMNDITELKETEELLRRSEERFAKAFYSASYAMTITDYTTGCHIIVNDSFLKLTGFERKEVIGYSDVELKFWLNFDTREQILRMLHKHGIVQNYDVLFKTKSGAVRNAHFSAVLIELDGDQRLLITIDDITEQKQMQQEVSRLERLNLIGQMAAGIGHEIRNPMTSVRGFLQILGSKSELVAYQSWFDLMIGELDRANSIITEYLSLAKNKPVEFSRLCLNNILETISPLINADALNGDKNVEWHLQKVPKISLDSEEIKQLVLNLVRNGLEAMTAGGTLTITTYIDGPDTILAVQDHGEGITMEVLEKLGTPFVSTKETGTGLGLPCCYAIAARHQATIDVETGPNGTTFRVRFKTEGT